MKVKSSLKKRHKDDIFVKRGKTIFIINKKNPKFKQRQK